jgi:hypothetical protein
MYLASKINLKNSQRWPSSAPNPRNFFLRQKARKIIKIKQNLSPFFMYSVSALNSIRINKKQNKNILSLQFVCTSFNLPQKRPCSNLVPRLLPGRVADVRAWVRGWPCSWLYTKAMTSVLSLNFRWRSSLRCRRFFLGGMAKKNGRRGEFPPQPKNPPSKAVNDLIVICVIF